MAAASSTGTGAGASNKVTTTELAMMANGPSIFYAGSIETVESGLIMSPPAPTGVVTLPRPLAGPADNYVIILTTKNAGSAYVAAITEDADDNLESFSFISEEEGTVYFLVVRKGFRTV